jgi:hypothetical protein
MRGKNEKANFYAASICSTLALTADEAVMLTLKDYFAHIPSDTLAPMIAGFSKAVLQTINAANTETEDLLEGIGMEEILKELEVLFPPHLSEEAVLLQNVKALQTDLETAGDPGAQIVDFFKSHYDQCYCMGRNLPINPPNTIEVTAEMQESINGLQQTIAANLDKEASLGSCMMIFAGEKHEQPACYLANHLLLQAASLKGVKVLLLELSLGCVHLIELE